MTEGRLAQSRSGQFVIHARSATMPDPALGTNQALVRLEPTVVAVSCERIKNRLWRDLGITGPWQSKVLVELYAARTTDETVTINVERFNDGWQYRMVMPDVLDRARYLRAATQVLLLELANRSAGTRCAEIPNWLIEGLSKQLMVSEGADLILPAPGVSVNRLTVWLPQAFEAQRADPLEPARREFALRPALSFQELSWPAQDQLEGKSAELYRSSAQLFVVQLLGLPGGPGCLRTMLGLLPQYYNWQFAFLAAFHQQFDRPRDVEKWWAFQVARFTGRPMVESDGVQSAWQKLDELVHPAIPGGKDTNGAPAQARTSLQSIVRDWNPAAQAYILEVKLNDLGSLKLQLGPDLGVLVDQYCQTIANYLQGMDRGGGAPHFRRKTAQRRAVEQTVKRLDALDAARLGLRPVQKTALPGRA